MHLPSLADTALTCFAVTFAMVLVRAQGGILYQDFSAMPDGKTVANIVIVLSCFAMLLGKYTQLHATSSPC